MGLLTRKKKQPALPQEEPVFPNYPGDNRKPTGRRTVAESIRQPKPARPQMPAMPNATPTIPAAPQMEKAAPEPDYYEDEPEPLGEEPEDQGDTLHPFADYLINNNLVEEFYNILKEKLELKEFYSNMVKAREVYGKPRKRLAQ